MGGIKDHEKTVLDHPTAMGRSVGDVTLNAKIDLQQSLDELSDREQRLLIYYYFIDLDENGRSVLMRRYNGLNWQEKPWEQRLAGQPILTINGVRFIHWCDCLCHQSPPNLPNLLRGGCDNHLISTYYSSLL